MSKQWGHGYYAGIRKGKELIDENSGPRIVLRHDMHIAGHIESMQKEADLIVSALFGAGLAKHVEELFFDFKNSTVIEAKISLHLWNGGFEIGKFIADAVGGYYPVNAHCADGDFCDIWGTMQPLTFMERVLSKYRAICRYVRKLTKNAAHRGNERP